MSYYLDNIENHMCDINIPENIQKVKIDIGLSYSAPQSNDWLKKEANLFVFGFEPNPYSVDNILQKNIKKQNINHSEPLQNEFIDTRFKLLPFALSNVENPTTTDFYCTIDDCGTSSLYKPHSCIGPIKDIATVKVYSLKHFFDLFPWERFDYIDYIKIDAQGADFDIIKSAGTYLKEKVVYLTAEPEENDYENCTHNTCENMTNYLMTQGFIKIDHPNTHDPTFLNTKFSNLADSIYIRQHY
jgi:FkbM family methyltransferase